MMRHIAACFALFVQLCPNSAHAQEEAGPSPVHVMIQGGSGVYMRVVGREKSPPVAQCTGDCSFWTLPGRYTVYTHDHTSDARHELNLRVKGFAQYRLNQGNDTVHGLGVGLEVVGIAASSLGLFTMLLPAMNQDNNDNARTMTIGLGILAGGIVSGLVGFGLETATRTELLPASEWSTTTRRQSRFRVGLVPVSAGLGLGALARF
jgi:hypothetical protein